MVDEFSLIETYFKDIPPLRPDTRLGVGDDCAIVRTGDNDELVITTDTLVEGVHFLAATDPGDIGYKAAAVNLSDIASMGAIPAWATLALSLPHPDHKWLKAFSAGFINLLSTYGVDLVGGDTVKGPNVITVQMMGKIESGTALTRSGAHQGESVMVTGSLGDAALGLKQLKGELSVNSPAADYLLSRLNRPTPRVEEGVLLRDLATACIDISDGLISDLGHIVKASGVGATLELDQIPCSPLVTNYQKATGDFAPSISGGDDYELCVVVPEDAQQEAVERLLEVGTQLTKVGVITDGERVEVVDSLGQSKTDPSKGYNHFE